MDSIRETIDELIGIIDRQAPSGLWDNALSVTAARLQRQLARADVEAAAAAAWPVGLKVRKVTGDYRIAGEVRGVVLTPEGRMRIVVAHRADGGTFLHIYGPGNLAPIEEASDAASL